MDSFPTFRLLRKRRAKPADWLGLRDWRWDEEALDGCGVESQALQTSHEVASDSFGVASVEVCLTEVGVGCLGGEDAMDGAAELVRDGEVVNEIHAADEDRAHQHDGATADDARPQVFPCGCLGWWIRDGGGHGFD